MKELNIALGIMVGAAVGDALGAPFEFLSSRAKQDFIIDMKGGGVLKWKIGDVTDDTIMSMAITDMYLTKRGYDQNHIISSWVDWKRTKPKDIGNWTNNVLSKWELQTDRSRVLRNEENPAVKFWIERGQIDAGNGSVMRCMPTAVARYKDEEVLSQETIWLSEDTHPDIRCVMSCLVINKLLMLAFRGASKIQAYTQIMAEVHEVGNFDIISALESAPDLPWDLWNNNGYSVDTLMCAVAAWLQFDSFEEGLIHVVNRGNDADTVGAVAGALLGAYHGIQAIPQRWLDTINHECKEKIIDDTKGLLKI